MDALRNLTHDFAFTNGSATKIAKAMVTRYGFSDRLGPIVYGQNESEVFLGRDLGHSRDYSETVAAQIDEEIRAVIDDAYDQCEQILSEHMDQLHKVAQYLFRNEKMSGEEFAKMMEGSDPDGSSAEDYWKVEEQVCGEIENEIYQQLPENIPVASLNVECDISSVSPSTQSISINELTSGDSVTLYFTLKQQENLRRYLLILKR